MMAQQQQQQQQQEEYMRQMAMQEQQRQQEEFMRQQWMQQQQQQMQQQQQQQSLFAQPTGYGSNNPFAPQTQQQQPAMPSFSSQPSSSFIPVPTVTQQQPQQQPTPQPVQPQQTAKPFQAPPKKDDGQHSQLASLLARGREDGLDTFGNTGNLRTSKQCNRDVITDHTGIPVGSGFHQSNRMAVQATGLAPNNPFGQMQQQQQQQQKPNDQPFFSV
jgi:epsin